MSESNTRRELLALFAALGAGAFGEAQAQDPAKVAARNYRVAFENDKVRVLEYFSRPRLGLCGQGRHSHPAHVSIAITAAKAKVTLADGSVILVENKPGDVFWGEAATHTVENVGGNDVRAYMVEIKDANWKPSTWSEPA